MKSEISPADGKPPVVRSAYYQQLNFKRMEEYIKWLENKIEVCLEDKDLQREHWAFCQALKKYRELALRQPLVSGRSEWDEMEDTRRSLRQGGIIRGTDEDEVGEGDANIIKRPSSPSKLDVADTNTTGLQRRKETGNTCDGWENRNKLFAGCCDGEKRRPVESDVGGVASRLSYWLDGYWRVEPDIPRVATDVKNRVDRLNAIGNGQVPAVVFTAWNQLTAGALHYSLQQTHGGQSVTQPATNCLTATSPC